MPIYIFEIPDMVKRRARLEKAISLGEHIFSLLDKMGYTPGRQGLADLWRAWPEAVGSDLAEVAAPLGSRGKELIIGAEDSLIMQELYYVTDEILEKVNGFLGMTYFDSIRIQLNSEGKNCLLPENPAINEEADPQPSSFQPTVSGKYLAQMDKDSPVARCYALFAGKRR